MSVFVFEPDLIFSSKFDGFSRLVGEGFRIFTDLTTLLEDSRSGKPVALVVNLDALKMDELRKLVTIGVPVMGYYSHVNSEMARAAAQSGVSSVVTRGTFVANAESLIRELLSRRPSS